jgi:hypothetical protein
MDSIWHGDWTDDEKQQMLLAIVEIEKAENDPNLRMTDKEHHDFMVKKCLPIKKSYLFLESRRKFLLADRFM